MKKARKQTNAPLGIQIAAFQWADKKADMPINSLVDNRQKADKWTSKSR
jgi:hypothetical protein